MPREVECLQHRLVQRFESETGSNAFQHPAMDDIQLGKRHGTGTYLLHCRLVLRTPRLRERGPVNRVAERLQDRGGLACDTGTPVDQRTEYVEEQRFHTINRLCGRGL